MTFSQFIYVTFSCSNDRVYPEFSLTNLLPSKSNRLNSAADEFLETSSIKKKKKNEKEIFFF